MKKQLLKIILGFGQLEFATLPSLSIFPISPSFQTKKNATFQRIGLFFKQAYFL